MWGSRTREVKRRNLRSHKVPLNVRDQIKRKFQSLGRIRKQKTSLLDRIQILKTKMEKLSKPIHRRQRLELQAELENVEQSLKNIEEDHEAKTFSKRIEPLLKQSLISDKANVSNTEDNQLQRQEALLMSLCQPENSIPVYIQTERCTVCREDLIVKTEEAKRVCPKCGTSLTFAPTIDDYYDFEHRGEANKSTNHGHSSLYMCAPLYRRHLMQWWEGTKDPPQHVLEIIHAEMWKVHIMLDVKVKPTPVCQILRNHNLQQYCWMAHRICKIMNNEKILKLSMELIDRLVYRFKVLQPAFHLTKSKARKKIINFTYFTRQGLIMEGLEHLAAYFDNHKTKTVLMKEDERLQKSCELLQDRNEAMMWNFRRSC